MTQSQKIELACLLSLIEGEAATLRRLMRENVNDSTEGVFVEHLEKGLNSVNVQFGIVETEIRTYLEGYKVRKTY